MGQADWTELGSSLSTASLARGVTAGVTPPTSSGANVMTYAFNSIVGTVTGAAGLYVDLAGFAPTGSGAAVADGGCSVRGCVKRLASPGNTGFSPFLFACAQATTVNDTAYMLGLSDADPYTIMLAKAPITSGLNASDSNVTIIGESSAQYAMGDGYWHHLRLDAIVQPNGDVLLKVFENDLGLRPLGNVAGPNWQNVTGFPAAGYVDDAVMINTGSAPLWGGYIGFAFAVAAALNRRGAFDGLEAYRVT